MLKPLRVDAYPPPPPKKTNTCSSSGQGAARQVCTAAGHAGHRGHGQPQEGGEWWGGGSGARRPGEEGTNDQGGGEGSAIKAIMFFQGRGVGLSVRKRMWYAMGARMLGLVVQGAAGHAQS